MKHHRAIEILRQFQTMDEHELECVLEAIACLERDDEYIGDMYRPIRIEHDALWESDTLSRLENWHKVK